MKSMEEGKLAYKGRKGRVQRQERKSKEEGKEEYRGRKGRV